MEGPSGYGKRVYEYVLDRANVNAETRLLDCGCGAGRFARMAADRGAEVAGIDAASELIQIASERTPEAEFRVRMPSTSSTTSFRRDGEERGSE